MKGDGSSPWNAEADGEEDEDQDWGIFQFVYSLPAEMPLLWRPAFPPQGMAFSAGGGEDRWMTVGFFSAKEDGSEGVPSP